MGIKIYKPYTPTSRNKSGLDFSTLTKIKPERSLLQIIEQKEETIEEELQQDIKVAVINVAIV
jgi:ribosomal protein L2